jgi:SAM-dependent methyltransferase
VECPLCGWVGHRFHAFLSADEIIPGCICPACGSFDRHRLLAYVIRNERHRSPLPSKIIAFSQSDCLQGLLAAEGSRRCLKVDYAPGCFKADIVTDLRNAGLSAGSSDWILCSHVLEHIPELELCLSEIARILRPGGTAWIQVPIEPGLARSRRIEVDPHRAHAHAWQFGADFGDLLERAEWVVEEVSSADVLTTTQTGKFGVALDERYWRLRCDDVTA